MSVPTSPRRPRTVTLVMLGVIFLGVWNAGRALVLFKQRTILIELQIRPSIWLQIFIAVGFCCLFLVCVWGLWQKRPFVQNTVPISVTGYAFYHVGIQILFAKSRNPSTWALTGLLFAGTILFTYWALNRSAAQTYFQDDEEGRERN